MLRRHTSAELPLCVCSERLAEDNHNFTNTGELQITSYKRRRYSQHFSVINQLELQHLISCSGCSVMIPEFEAWNLNITQLYGVFRGGGGEEGMCNFNICFHLQFLSVFNISK